VPGIHIPNSLLQAYGELELPEQRRISLDFCIGTATQMADVCAGFYVMAAPRLINETCALVRELAKLR